MLVMFLLGGGVSQRTDSGQLLVYKGCTMEPTEGENLNWQSEASKRQPKFSSSGLSSSAEERMVGIQRNKSCAKVIASKTQYKAHGGHLR